MASAGWPALIEMDGEPVTYTRHDGAAAATGFPKSIDVLFRVDNASRKQYEDGRGDLSVGVVELQVSDIGGLPEIGTDTIARADGTVWSVEDVREAVGGIATVEVARYELVESTLGGYRTKR